LRVQEDLQKIYTAKCKRTTDNHHYFAERLPFVNSELRHSQFSLSRGREGRHSKCHLGSYTVSVYVR